MRLLVDAPTGGLAAVVHEGLAATPKTLPCRFFYDQEGSALFEEICELPEYYVTRTEDEILRRRAPEIIAALPDRVDLAELGSGSSRKTRRIIEALLERQRSLRYLPIDISATMLRETARALSRDYPRLEVDPLALEYSAALDHLPAKRQGPLLVLFLGGNLGNFDPPAAIGFLRQIAAAMQPGDGLLLGLDLHKETAVLNAAYDDSQGVTARFNLNLLRRLNRELEADFHLDAFRHRAFYNEAEGRVEMHLVSLRDQSVTIAGRRVEFRAGETIHTENSYKYTRAQIQALAHASGFSLQRQWTDDRGYFSVNLLAPLERPQ
jgi:dimethylhistidine N-methyltransferase